MKSRWKFFKSARCVQVKLETGADLEALPTLDPKLWTILSAPVKGGRFDAPTLQMIDTDGDGRIRIQDVLHTVAWLKARFQSLDFLFARKAEVACANVNTNTPEGTQLLASFKNILARAGKSEQTSLTLEDVLGATALLNAQPLNGDGVITALSTSDAKLTYIIEKILSVSEGVTDRMGQKGLDQAHIDQFFSEAERYLAWLDADPETKWAQSTTHATPLAKLWEDFLPARDIIENYFKVSDELPLVAEDPTPSLPLRKGVNPRYKEILNRFAIVVVSKFVELGKYDTLTRETWAKIKEWMDLYSAWQQAKPTTPVQTLDEKKLRAWVSDADLRTQLTALISQDLACAPEYEQLVTCEKALRLSAHFVDWLENFVNQMNIYTPGRTSVFDAGKLYLDGRTASLCFSVDDLARHAALAEKSKCCLVYATLTRGTTTRLICAVITAGTTTSLYVGRNGIFYDPEGNEWDATVSKVVEAQVSLREAFWSPWAKIANTLSEQFKKFLATKQDATVGKVVTQMSTPPPTPPNGAVLASSVAALGMGVGMAGAACAGLIGLVAGLPFWKVLAGVAAIVLFVSLPSVILAWFKLRARDLSAILNAGGWAVNRPLTFSLKLARTWTARAEK